MTFPIFSLEELLRFLFLIVRLSAIVLTLPVLNTRSVPSHLKLIFIVVFSLSLYPAVRTQPLVVPQGVLHLGLLILGELFLGMIIGFVAQMAFMGMQMGGELMNQQMGLSMASIFDPQTQRQTTIMSNFQYVMAVLLFFSIQAHHWFIFAMAESLHAMPLLSFTVPKTVMLPLVALLSKAFIMALRIAAPVIVTLILTNITLGMMARLVPQMNIFILSFPVNFGVGLILVGLALPYILKGGSLVFGRLGRDILEVLRLVGGT